MKVSKKVLFVNIIIPLMVALVFPILAGMRLADHSHWLTGVNRLHWLLANGRPVNSDRYLKKILEFGCHAEMSPYALLDGQTIWTHCYLDYGRYALAKITPKDGVATLWELPSNLKIYEAYGLARGPNDEIAFVYDLADNNYSTYAIGVMGQSKWSVKPELITDVTGYKLLSTTWLDGKFDAIFLRQYEDQKTGMQYAESRVVTLDHGKFVTKKLFPKLLLYHFAQRSKKMVVLDRVCRISHGDNGWKLWLLKPDEDRVAEISQNGTQRDIGKQALCGEISRSKHEIVAFDFMDEISHYPLGITKTSLNEDMDDPNSWVQLLNGKLVPAEMPPGKNWRNFTVTNYASFFESGLAMHPLWWFQDTNGSSIYKRNFHRGWLQTQKNQNNDQLIVSILDANSKSIVSKPVADIYFSTCSDLVDDVIPVSRDDGGFWLVSTEGCYVNLSSDLRRLDSYSIAKHLREDEYPLLFRWGNSNLAILIFVMIGLPILLILGLGFARLRGMPAFRGISIGAYSYSVFALWGLFNLWPMLR